MQKYIAVVNPRMDDDDISKMIAKGVAGALFSISQQNYPLALQLINRVKALAKKNNRPVSIIQDVSSMEDPLDLEVGVKGGAHWVMSDNHEHLKMARGLSKLIGVINKGTKLPKELRVDSVMSDMFADPDVEIVGSREQIKHLITSHDKQSVLDSLSDFAEHTGSSSIALSDINLAKALAWRRIRNKIVFAPKDHSLAEKAAIYQGLNPIYLQNDLIWSIKHNNLAKKGERVVDATDPKHVEIRTIE